MDTTLCDLPMCVCPHCKDHFQWGDYYDARAGSTLDCPICEKTIYVLRVDTTITAELSAEPDDA